MDFKVEQGIRATLVVTPVAGKPRCIDGLSEIRNYLNGLELKAMLDRAPAPLGSKENPHDTGAPTLKRGYYTLHPRVLNDPELPKSFKDEAKRVFTGELDPDYITQVWFNGDEPVQGAVRPNGKGQFYVDYRVPVKCNGWYGGAVMNIAANDLIKQDTSGVAWSSLVKAERRLYRQWKDAQLKEAKCLTKKRIMKALAGPKDAKLKMGDRLIGAYTTDSYLFIGYVGTAYVVLNEVTGRVSTGNAATHHLPKKGGN